jgi:hypothetical protein
MPMDKSKQLLCELPDGTIAGLPDWMMDSRCNECSQGEPLIALAALRELRDFLSALQNGPKCDKASLKLPEEGAHDTTDEA